MPHIYALVGVSQPFDPSNRFTTSVLVPTLVLALLRLLVSLYTFITIFVILGWNCTHGQADMSRQWFAFFTNLSAVGLAFYFLFSGLHTLGHALKGKNWLSDWPRPLQAAHSILYTTIVTYPPLVTIVYWGVLYYNPWFTVAEEGWSNVSEHGLNSLFALMEILLTRTSPPPPLHLAFLIFILALYLSLAYLSRATQGFYPYPFLDPNIGSGKVTGYCVGILAAVCVIFGIVWCIIWLRGWAARRLGLDYDRGGRRANVPQEGTEGEPSVAMVREEAK